MERHGLTLTLFAIALTLLPFISMGCTDSTAQRVEIQVDYTGDWSGTINDDGVVLNIDGFGFFTKSITATSIEINVKKDDDGLAELIVKIVQDGKVLARGNSFEIGGSVKVTYSFV